MAALDAEGFFHTGDLARSDGDGSITVVGRAQDMIVSSGEHIHPAEVEHLLAQHPWVAECAVVGRPDEQLGEICVAVVVLRDGAPATWADDIAASLDGQLPRHKWPRRWHQAPALPRSALGKVQKPAVRAWLASQPTPLA